MVRFSLRVPTPIYAALKNQAHEQHRSVNQQIVAILEAATKTDWVAEDHGQPLAELEDDGEAGG